MTSYSGLVSVNQFPHLFPTFTKFTAIKNNRINIFFWMFDLNLKNIELS